MTPHARSRSRVGPAIVATTLALVLRPVSLDAHLVTTGLGPVYDGITHVLMSPDDLVAALALALLAGLNGPAAGRRALFGVTAAWLLGGVAGFLVGRPMLPASTPAVSFLVMGLLAAADRRLAPAAVAGLAVALGLLHGWLNGVGIAEAQLTALGLGGIAAAIFVVVALAAALAASLRAAWARVAVRVVGSWVAAIGLLMLGWAIRGGLAP